MNVNAITSEVVTGAISAGTFEKDIFHADPAYIPSQVIYPIPIRVVYAIASIVSLGLIPLTLYGLSLLLAKRVLLTLNATQEEKRQNSFFKQMFIKYEQKTTQEFELNLSDGVSINGMALFRQSDAKLEFLAQAAEDQKWILHFNGNNSFYESNLLRFQEAGRHLDANILLFNYRGTGESRGYPAGSKDLIADGEACVQYLLSKGVKEEDILIHGYSLGGGVGTQVASLHDRIALINERSFASLSGIASVLTRCSLVAPIFRLLGWELDSVTGYANIKADKLIVYHKQDYIIPYHKTSLYKVFKDAIKKQNSAAVEEISYEGKVKYRLLPEYKPAAVKLQRQFPKVTGDAHCYYLQNDNAYPQIKRFIRDFLAQSYPKTI